MIKTGINHNFQINLPKPHTDPSFRRCFITFRPDLT